MAAEELVVDLTKRNDSSGLGFSLLGISGLPHIVYDIVENSPAAESGEVQAGDVILRVNEIDVRGYTTKEVLKCLRLSGDTVSLTLKRDPVIKSRALCYLSSGNSLDPDEACSASLSASSSASPSPASSRKESRIPRPQRATKRSSDSSTSSHHKKENSCKVNSSRNSPCSPISGRNGSATASKCECPSPISPAEEKKEKPSPKSQLDEWGPLGGPGDSPDKSGPPRFEAYMMTGDLILKLSRTQQSSVLPKHQKKVDSLLLRHHHNHHHNNNNSHNHRHHHNSVPTSPNESQLGLRTHKGGSSPTSNSAGASPVGPNKHDIFQDAALSYQSTSASGDVQSSTANPPAHSKFGYHHHAVRTSRSEDQLQKDSSMSAVDIDIDMDEDVTSSLNTLLDTRQDTGSGSSTDFVQTADGRIVWTYNAPEWWIRLHGDRMPSSLEELEQCRREISSSSSGLAEPCGGRPHSGTNPATHSVNPSYPHYPLLHPQSRSNSNTNSEDGVLSPVRSSSPSSPTSVSSSVMSSNSGDVCATNGHGHVHGHVGHPPTSSAVHHQPNGDLSQSEGVSNISSPDFQEEDNMDILSARDLMELTDPSDSDSTLLVSERGTSKHKNNSSSGSSQEPNAVLPNSTDSMHRIVIQVKGPDKDSGGGGSGNDSARLRQKGRPGYQELRDSEEDQSVPCGEEGGDDGSGSNPASPLNKAASPPLSSEDESDIESLHSYHYSPKGVDMPSAIRLAKRLYSLDGFKKSDVSKHLSKNNDFSRAVAEEYLKYFNFDGDTLDAALRKFLKQFSLTGETQERERVLVHFSKRYLDCNPGSFRSQDAVHTLTCAIMLLNTDLHAQNVGRKMTCLEFIENLSELNDGDNFPRDVLKMLYQAIKCYPLEWALDADGDECALELDASKQHGGGGVANPFLDVPNASAAVEYKKGYVMRKCCVDPNGKKTPFGKRGWRMYYCTVRDLVLYLHKDEHGFRKSQLSDNLHNAIRIHHALATKATDYKKKQHVFRLQTADLAEYLFQTSDSKELQSWIDTINFVCASFSAQPLASGVGSQRKFQRPLLPCSHTKLNLREQLRDHEDRVQRLEAELEDLRSLPERGARGANLHNNREKEAFLHYELKRYRTYAYLLRSRMSQYPELVEPSLMEESCLSIAEEDLNGTEVRGSSVVPPPVPDRRSPPTNRNDHLQLEAMPHAWRSSFCCAGAQVGD